MKWIYAHDFPVGRVMYWMIRKLMTQCPSDGFSQTTVAIQTHLSLKATDQPHQYLELIVTCE